MRPHSDLNIFKAARICSVKVPQQYFATLKMRGITNKLVKNCSQFSVMKSLKLQALLKLQLQKAPFVKL